MQIFDGFRRTWRWTAGYSNPNNAPRSPGLPASPQHTYKPKAIRIPSLLSLFFLFVISFTALQILLDRTIKPSEYYAKHEVHDKARRQAQQCPSAEENSRILSSLLSEQAALCTTYTTTFKPETTSLPPPMQTSFDSWLAEYSSMEAQLEHAQSCASSQSAIASLSSLLNPTTTISSTNNRTTTSASAAATASSAGNTASATSNGVSQTQVTTGSSQSSSSLSITSNISAGSTVQSQSVSLSATSNVKSAVPTSVGSNTVAAATLASSSNSVSQDVADSSSVIGTSTVSSSSESSSTTSSTTSGQLLTQTTSVQTSISDPTSLSSGSISTTSTISASSPSSSPSISSSTRILSSPTSTLSSTTTISPPSTTSALDTSTTSQPTTSFSTSTTTLSSFSTSTAFGPFTNSSSTTSTVTSIFQDDPSTTTPTSSMIPQCTESGQSCTECGYEVCSCQYAIFKRQASTLSCVVDPCHCVLNGDDYICSQEDDYCASTSISITTSSITTDTTTPTTTTSTITTSSEALVCTTDGQPCQCSYEYCACYIPMATYTGDAKRDLPPLITSVPQKRTMTEDPYECGPDPCHCTENTSGIYDCTSADLCQSITTTTTSTITATTTSSSLQPTCTEQGSACFDCGYDYCLCDESSCVVDTCYCPASDEGGYKCSSTNTCSSRDSCSEPDVESGQACYTCDADICECLSERNGIELRRRDTLACAPSECHCQRDEYTGQYLCGDFDICDDICSGPLSNGTTCSSCDSDGECTCSGGLCQPQATDNNTTCTAIGEACDTCNVSLCECQEVSYGDWSVGKRDSLYCENSVCHCQENPDTGDVDCSQDWDICTDVCSGPFSEGLDCYTCDADESGVCSCQTGVCALRPDYCGLSSNEGASCLYCGYDSCECSSGACLRQDPDCVNATLGTPCSSNCYSESCTCQFDLYNTKRAESDDPVLYCTNDPCTASDSDYASCYTCESGNCQCLSNACTDYVPESTDGPLSPTSTTTFSTTTYSTTSAINEPLPGATCNPSSTTCYNCAADKCSCRSDGWCVVDTCYCAQPTPGVWSCGSLNSCQADACDESVLQCFDCNDEDPDAACYCATGGICEEAPCPDCQFYDDGTVMTCPDSCKDATRRSLKAGTLGYKYLLSNISLPVGEDLHHDSHPWIGSRQKRQAEIAIGPTPVRDAWNYLLWTEALTIRRTSSSVVSTVTAATFTLDVFPGGSTSWPPLTATPPLAYMPTIPACVPATLIAPASAPRTITKAIQKRDLGAEATKAYVTRESTTVVVRIRDNYLELTSDIPTITRQMPVTNTLVGAQLQLSSYTMAVESIGADGERTTASVVVIEPTSAGSNDSPTETSSGGADGGYGGAGGGGGPGSNGVVQKVSDSKRIVNTPFTLASYVLAMYGPALLTVTIKVVFETQIASFKMAEPFERLHTADGSSAEESLSSQYLSSSVSFDSLRSAFSGRSIPLWNLIIYLLVTTGAPLSSASMTVQPMNTCNIGGFTKQCQPAWILEFGILRAMQAVLLVCMILVMVLIFDSWFYHAGVPSNPTSIASVAILLNYEPLRHDLQAIDPEATEKELSHNLGGYHFWLMSHNPTRTEARYGLVHSPVARVEHVKTGWEAFLHKLERVKQVAAFESNGVHRVVDGLHLFTITALLALLLTYRLNLNNDAFNYFFASSGFWPKFIVVGLATVIDMQWKNLEREVRIIEPYRRMWYGNARPEHTILCDLNGTCWSNLPRLFRGTLESPREIWFEASVCFTAALSDINIIAVSGVLMTYSQTKAAYEWSSVMALISTSIMLAVVLLTMIWWRRTEGVKALPRKPETIAAVLSYLCSSQMPVELAQIPGIEHMSAEERDHIILSQRKRYKFGLMMGEDGRERYVIDYDDDEISDDGSSTTRESWLAEKMARPTAIRLSS